MVAIQIHKDSTALGRSMADEILALYQASSGDFLLGCPGGRTPKPIYAAMAQKIRAENMDISRMIIVMMDDYVEDTKDGYTHVDGDAHFSCRRFARADILDVLNAGLDREKQIQPHNLWFPNPSEPDAYDQRLEAAGGIDYFILASGAGDGHVAFNPPGSNENSISRVVKLAEQTRRDNLVTFPDFNGIDDVPRYGVTVGISTIAKHSKAAGMALWGADKHHAFTIMQASNGYNPDWPASVILICQNATIHADEAAQNAGQG